MGLFWSILHPITLKGMDWKNQLIRMLKYALWADRITTKKAIGSSPFQLLYGTDAVFPIQLGIPVIKFFQDIKEEPNDIQRRIFSLIELQQEREALA